MNKEQLIREFADMVGVEIIGDLVHYPEYEYEDDGFDFYADDRCESEDCVGFWIDDEGRIKIFCCENDAYYELHKV